MLVKLGIADLADGELRPYQVGEQYVLVARLGDRLHAIDDLCNHAGCLLSSGWVEDGAVICPCHEYTFDLATGKNVTFPRLCGDQASYRVAVDRGDVYVDLPEAAE